MGYVNSRIKGVQGEKIVLNYLVNKGYKIIARNWYCRYGEIDIITRKDAGLVFVEVKYVTSKSFCDAVELFGYRKKNNILKTIKYFEKKISPNSRQVAVRFNLCDTVYFTKMD